MKIKFKIGDNVVVSNGKTIFTVSSIQIRNMDGFCDFQLVNGEGNTSWHSQDMLSPHKKQSIGFNVEFKK